LDLSPRLGFTPTAKTCSTSSAGHDRQAAGYPPSAWIALFRFILETGTDAAAVSGVFFVMFYADLTLPCS
jgi:hypothetical protein